MKQIIIGILSALFHAIDTLLCRLHIKRPKVIIYMDGGICSQMFVYTQGQYYAEAGLDVYYDILWFETCGKDSEGLMPRYFEFKEMWPKSEFKTVNKLQRKWYLVFFNAKRLNGDLLPKPTDIKHSVYLNGFWDFPQGESERQFKRNYRIENADMPPHARIITFDGVVGIHVRRGDLAKGDNPYYGAVTDGYFLRAIEFCNTKFNPSKYIFFSDEPDWVEQNICNQLTQPYEIMRGNKAWEDLWLLAHCPVIVASQGSFGSCAARLNPDAVLIKCDNRHADRNRPNTYFIA